jgi:putative phosphoesterase
LAENTNLIGTMIMERGAMARIGLISDTHGLLRQEALALLQGCDHIVHGGDIGNPDILTALAAIAPLTVVRGNNDRQEWASHLPETALLTVDGVTIFAVHDIAQARGDPAAVAAQVIVTGHSHQPAVVESNGVLYVNPGSAGPRRFKLPISVAELLVEDGAAAARILEITPS